MSPEWYEDTFIMAPALIIGCAVTVTIGLVILGITIARYVVRRWDE